MSYALKASGLATALVACVMVDDDGTTIKEFKGNTSGVVNGAVTVSTSTWKGVSRKYFQTLANGTFNFFGITWTSANGPQVSFVDSDGGSVFAAFAGNSPGSASQSWVSFGETTGGLGITAGGKATLNFGPSAPVSTTTVPTDGSSKFSVGGNWRGDGVSPQHAEILYGTEAGSLASEHQVDPGQFGGNTRLTGIGGPGGGNGNQPAKFFIVAVFNRELTEAEMQSLHNDWFGTLFLSDVTASGGIGTATSSAPAGTAAPTVFASGVIATATTSAPAGSAANVTASLSGQLIALNGAAVASVTGITFEFRKSVPTTPTLPDKVVANVSTDGSGNFGPISLSDMGLLNGQAVYVVMKKDGSPYRGGNFKATPTYGT